MKRKRALVLSGGGAKGCYEIGAWRALREERFHFDAVVGASVGALNAAFVAQDDFSRAEDLWSTISLDRVVKIPKEFINEQGLLNINFENIRELKRFEDALVNKRLDSSPLDQLVREYVNEKLVRSKKVDLGLVTYNVSAFKPLHIFITEMKEGELASYLLASASFPIFNATKINGKNYIDGGIKDNIPFNMVKDRGYRDIIVIDISGMGINKRPDITGTCTMYIKNSLDFGSLSDFYGVLRFEVDFLRDFKQLGYLDTKKVLGYYQGYRYYIAVKQKWLEEMEEKLFSDQTLELIKTKFYEHLSKKQQKMFENGIIDKRNFFESFLPEDMRNSQYLSLAWLECLAFCCGIEVLKGWRNDILISEIRRSLNNLDVFDLEVAEIEFKQYTDLLFKSGDIDKRAERMYAGKEKLPSPFEYSKAAEILVGEKQKIGRGVAKAILAKFPQLLPARIFSQILF